MKRGAGDGGGKEDEGRRTDYENGRKGARWSRSGGRKLQAQREFVKPASVRWWYVARSGTGFTSADCTYLTIPVYKLAQIHAERRT